jgi:hypothetical protein
VLSSAFAVVVSASFAFAVVDSVPAVVPVVSLVWHPAKLAIAIVPASKVLIHLFFISDFLLLLRLVELYNNYIKH